MSFHLSYRLVPGKLLIIVVCFHLCVAISMWIYILQRYFLRLMYEAAVMQAVLAVN